MLTDTRQMLEKAREGGWAVGAFNVENAEMIWAVLQAAEAQKAPVILQTTPSTLRYLPPAYFGGMVSAAAREVSVPVALHLDHGNSLELVEACLDAGYTSVMLDGSALPFPENIGLTAKAAAIAQNRGASCEGELGAIGGKEDDLSVEAGRYTDPEEAAQFVRQTGVDSLAVAIGTAHGVYPKTPVLDFARIARIREMTPVPLVLHGSSGLADMAVREAVARGMAKVNFATELRQAFTAGVRAAVAADPDGYDPKSYLAKARQQVQKLVEQKIRVLGAAEQA